MSINDTTITNYNTPDECNHVVDQQAPMHLCVFHLVVATAFAAAPIRVASRSARFALERAVHEAAAFEEEEMILYVAVQVDSVLHLQCFRVV